MIVGDGTPPDRAQARLICLCCMRAGNMPLTPHALFVTDLDGTLLDPERAVPARNLAAMARAVEAGVVVAVATGRRLSSLRREYAKLDGLSYRAATSNGAVILRPDNLWPEAVHALAWEQVDTLAARPELARSRRICIVAPAERLELDDGHPDCVVVDVETGRWLCSWTPYEQETLTAIEPARFTARSLVHVAFEFATTEGAARAAEGLRAHLPAPLSMHVIGRPYGDGAYLELIPRGGKGLALRHLARTLAIAPERTGAVGDERNDRDLLAAARHRYVVRGSPLAAAAPDATQEVATASEGAVADALERFMDALD